MQKVTETLEGNGSLIGLAVLFIAAIPNVEYRSLLYFLFAICRYISMNFRLINFEGFSQGIILLLSYLVLGSACFGNTGSRWTS